MKLKAISWLADTPKRAINQAYQAALKIKAIEERYFSAQKPNVELVRSGKERQKKPISADTCEYNDRVVNYLQAEVKKYLKIIKIRLKEFQISCGVLRFFGISLAKSDIDRPFYLEDNHKSNFIEQFELIEAILNKYERPLESNRLTPPSSITKIDTVSDKTSFLPRSFFRTFNRIKEDISPQSPEKEAEALQKYRQSRQKTIISCRFLLILIVIPFLTYQITKTLIIKPIITSSFITSDRVIFIDEDLKEEAFEELQHFEDRLHFISLIANAPEITEKERQRKLEEKVAEILEKYRQHSIDAISNIFADLISFFSFAVIIFFSQREILVFKAFLDSIIYGLSDSAKAFLIILITDMFVGFHSPHGWEIILESTARHFGFPESREFNFLFIATFPVILDTVLKYWIFRYLNRISPSSVATYRDMNK